MAAPNQPSHRLIAPSYNGEPLDAPATRRIFLLVKWPGGAVPRVPPRTAQVVFAPNMDILSADARGAEAVAQPPYRREEDQAGEILGDRTAAHLGVDETANAGSVGLMGVHVFSTSCPGSRRQARLYRWRGAVDI